MAGPGINGFGRFRLFKWTNPIPPNPVGFKGVFAIGKKTGLIDGWKLYANLFGYIPFRLLLSRGGGL